MTAPGGTIRFTASSPEELPQALDDAQAKSAENNAPLFIHVRADWCPDCTSTDAAVHSAFEARSSPAVLLTALVHDRAAYRTAQYPYREHPLLKIRVIPTLIRVADDARLVEDECGDLKVVSGLLE